MANLKALREKIKNITDYSPELQQFNDQLDELINDAFYEIWTSKRWNFATKQAFLKIYPDITPTSNGYDINANVTKGERRVTFSVPVDQLADVDVWSGTIISIQNQEYVINKINDLQSIFLETAFEGETASDDTTWTIKKRYLDLPQDCLELLYLGHRDFPYNLTAGTQVPYGKSTGLFPRREEDYDLRADLTRTYSEAYIPTPSINLPAAETLSVTASAGGGTFTDGLYYEFCWAFLKDGKLSALSEPKTVQIDGESRKIRIDFLTWNDDAIATDALYYSDDQFAPKWEGYTKVIYFNKNFSYQTGERLGLPCWTSVINGGTRSNPAYLYPVVVPDSASFVEILNPNQLDGGNKRYIERDGQWEQLRLYPRPQIANVVTPRIGSGDSITQRYDAWSEMVMRYYKKPTDILLSTDSPEMPVEFHQLIVYKALENIFMKLGQTGMSSTYEKKYLGELKNLEKRYVDKVDFDARRSSFTGDSYPYRGYNGSSLRRMN